MKSEKLIEDFIAFVIRIARKKMKLECPTFQLVRGEVHSICYLMMFNNDDNDIDDAK